MFILQPVNPVDLRSADPTDIGQFDVAFLGEGDSWFSLGSRNLFRAANLLNGTRMQRRACVVNCAAPGDTLRRMVDGIRDPEFLSLLNGARATHWPAILLSAGGNDLIDALNVLPTGEGASPAKRLLLTREEWGAPTLGAARYLSDKGWETFCGYLRGCFAELIAQRDHPRSHSRGVPVFLHTYHIPTPNNVGSGGKSGPWLMPALVAYGVPQEDWTALARLLIERLSDLLISVGADSAHFPGIVVFDSARQVKTVKAAELNAAGPSGDWENEIHLTRGGYAKIGTVWGRAIDAALDNLVGVRS